MLASNPQLAVQPERIESTNVFAYYSVAFPGSSFSTSHLMLEFEVQRCTRRCAKTERELAPGETFYSVLTTEGADVVRSDVCEAAWEGPPEDALGWWKSQMPTPQSNKVHWAPNDVMLHYFELLEGQQEKADVRYVLALLMLRRRVIRWEESEEEEGSGDTMVLFCPRNEKEYKVAVTTPTSERIAAIQDELAKLLFADAA